jgi:2-methylcitrate dehydratase
MTTLAEDIAQWVSALSYETLPSEIITRTKLILLDTVGCALAALDAPPVRLARQVAREQGGNPLATPFGARWRTSAEMAAFINALAARYLDFNDYTVVGSHPSTNIGTVLAVGEAQAASGKELIVGINVAYEMQLRMRDASEHQNDGWDNSTLEHYSAAALAGRLLKLSVPQLAHALGIAAAHANTLAEVRRGQLSMWKAAAEAMSAKMGTFAALLARAGITGPLSAIDGEYGFGKVVVGEFEPEYVRRFDGQFSILKSCIKIWPCLFVAQAPIAAAVELYDQGIRAEEIDKIDIYLSEFGYTQQLRFQKSGVRTREDADHSVTYCVARVFLDGTVWLPHFEEHKLKEPAVVELMKKVTFHRDDSLPKRMGAAVEVTRKRGGTGRARVPYAPGHINNPVGESEIKKKFHALADDVIGAEKARAAADMILHLEELPGPRELMESLAAPAKVD